MSNVQDKFVLELNLIFNEIELIKILYKFHNGRKIIKTTEITVVCCKSRLSFGREHRRARLKYNQDTRCYCLMCNCGVFIARLGICFIGIMVLMMVLLIVLV